MSKWQLALMGMGGILSVMLIVWLAYAGISYSTSTHAISSERSHIEKSHDNSNQHVTEADFYFIERAHATEAGFNAAFPFRK